MCQLQSCSALQLQLQLQDSWCEGSRGKGEGQTGSREDDGVGGRKGVSSLVESSLVLSCLVLSCLRHRFTCSAFIFLRVAVHMAVLFSLLFGSRQAWSIEINCPRENKVDRPSPSRSIDAESQERHVLHSMLTFHVPTAANSSQQPKTEGPLQQPAGRFFPIFTGRSRLIRRREQATTAITISPCHFLLPSCSTTNPPFDDQLLKHHPIVISAMPPPPPPRQPQAWASSLS